MFYRRKKKAKWNVFILCYILKDFFLSEVAISVILSANLVDLIAELQ